MRLCPERAAHQRAPESGDRAAERKKVKIESADEGKGAGEGASATHLSCVGDLQCCRRDAGGIVGGVCGWRSKYMVNLWLGGLYTIDRGGATTRGGLPHL